MPVNLDSDIWDRDKRYGVVSRGLTRIAKIFKTRQVNLQINSPHTGRITRPALGGPGVGFGRFHRASARGERPSPDTMNLINSMKDEKTAELVHVVYVDDNQAPYGKWLQDPDNLDRPIATAADAEDFEGSLEFREEVSRMKRELISNSGRQ